MSPIWIPINCGTLIFGLLSRDELDSARSVCRKWNKAIISGPDRKRYQKRRLEAVEISSNYEYSVRAYYNQKIKLLTFKKYFCSLDLLSVEKCSEHNFDSNVYSYPCSHEFHADSEIDSEFRFSNNAIHGFRSKYCSNKELQIFNRQLSYESKIFTPQLDFYVRLKWLLEHSTIKSLVFIDFAFTELFVEKFEEYFGIGYQVDKLYIHNCSLKHISSSTFHRFIGQIVKADEYYLEIPKNALPNHVNDALLQMPNMITANVVLISGVATRHPRIGGNESTRNFNITEQGFGNYLEKRKGTVVESPNSFFGIQSTGINAQQFVNNYAQEYRRQPRSHLFKHIIFGNHKFIATD